MGILLSLSRIYVPDFIKKHQLENLFRDTAVAFQAQSPSLKYLNYKKCLEQYAIFTSKETEKSIRMKNDLEARDHLYEITFRLGQKLRQRFGISTLNDAIRISEVVYKILQIDLSGNSRGEIVIRRCYFSAFYSPEVCTVISSLDAGLLAGLSGGGRLQFSRRITEGHNSCLARLEGVSE